MAVYCPILEFGRISKCIDHVVENVIWYDFDLCGRTWLDKNHLKNNVIRIIFSYWACYFEYVLSNRELLHILWRKLVVSRTRVKRDFLKFLSFLKTWRISKWTWVKFSRTWNHFASVKYRAIGWLGQKRNHFKRKKSVRSIAVFTTLHCLGWSLNEWGQWARLNYN